MTNIALQDANALAAAVGAKMFENDKASRGLGMTLDQVGVGHATMSMRVRADMLNGLGTCHGGFIFTLADSTFAFACNSRNLVTVAAGAHIEFLRPAHENDVLTASAQEIALAGRSGVYDIIVANQHGDTVATFRGKSAQIKGEIVNSSEAG
jgi:acyl-CoA thioesterase